MNFARLFRCSNDKGYFTVSEKCSDFCQVSNSHALSTRKVKVILICMMVYLRSANTALHMLTYFEVFIIFSREERLISAVLTILDFYLVK